MPRQPKQPAAAKIAALEALDGSVFDENYRRRVVAALPPGTTASEEFWADLEAAFNTYLLWELRRLRRPPLAEREQWRRNRKPDDGSDERTAPAAPTDAT